MRMNEPEYLARHESATGTASTVRTAYTIRETLTVAGPERDLLRLSGAFEVTGTLRQNGVGLNLTDFSVKAGSATFTREACTLKLCLEAPSQEVTGILSQLSRKFPRLLFHLHAETYDGSMEQLCFGGNTLLLAQEPWTECEDWDDGVVDKTVSTSPAYDAEASLCESVVDVYGTICRTGVQFERAVHLMQGLLGKLAKQ